MSEETKIDIAASFKHLDIEFDSSVLFDFSEKEHDNIFCLVDRMVWIKERLSNPKTNEKVKQTLQCEFQAMKWVFKELGLL